MVIIEDEGLSCFILNTLGFRSGSLRRMKRGEELKDYLTSPFDRRPNPKFEQGFS